MLIRLLVFILSLNAFALPAMATVGCEKMSDSKMVSMPHDMSNHDMSAVEMECCMDHDDSCNSSQCMTSSAANFPLFSLENTKSFAEELLSKRPKDNLLSLYEIILPINTQPPLV